VLSDNRISMESTIRLTAAVLDRLPNSLPQVSVADGILEAHRYALRQAGRHRESAPALCDSWMNAAGELAHVIEVFEGAVHLEVEAQGQKPKLPTPIPHVGCIRHSCVEHANCLRAHRRLAAYGGDQHPLPRRTPAGRRLHQLRHPVARDAEMRNPIRWPAPKPISSDTSWRDVEMSGRFPDAATEWDVQGGPEWLGEREPMIVLNGKTLAVGCGDREPYGWALWHEDQQRWLLL
jgi:hypothetical protein